MISVKSNKGNALVEFSVALPALVGVLGIALPLLYYAFAHLWIQWCVHEGLICLLKNLPSPHCRQEAKERISSVLPIGEVRSLLFSFDDTSVQGRVVFYISQNFKIHRTLRLTNHEISDESHEMF